METNDPKRDEAEATAKADLAEDRAAFRGDSMELLYRDALAKCGDPALATAAAMNQWLFGRGGK